MVIIKVKRDISGQERYLKNAIKYVHDKDGEPPISLDGNGVDFKSVTGSFEQMYLVKQYFGKTSGNPLVHIIVGFDQNVKDGETASRLAWSIAAHFMHDYQYLVCTHAKDQKHGFYHCHIILNSVSFKDGKMFHSGISEMSAFCDYVGWITGRPTKLVFEKTIHEK